MMTPDEPHFCTYCAAPLNAGAPFCANCGRAVPAHIDHSVPSAPEMRPCGFCGAPTEPGDRFCPVCGHEPSRWVSAADRRAAEASESDDGLPRWIGLIAIVVALLAGGALGLQAIGFFGDSATPLPSAVVVSPPPTLEVASPEPVPSASPATPSESPSPAPSEAPSPSDIAPSFDPFASPSPALGSPGSGLGSQSPAPETSPSAFPSFPLESPTPSPAARIVVVGRTRTDPPARGNFRVTLKEIDVLADSTMQFVFHVKNVRQVDDCVRLNSDGLDDFLVDSANTRYPPTGWATATGPLPLDQCGPTLHPGDAWDYFDIFPALDDPSRTFDLTIYHGDLVFTGLSIAP